MRDDSGADEAGIGEVHAPLPTVEEVLRHRLSLALGGWRGSIETALPTLVFVGLWSLRRDLKLAIIAAAVVGLVLCVARLAQRQKVQHPLAGLGGVAIAAFFVWRSGRAEDAFLPGIITTAAYGAAGLLSVLTKWPIVGFIAGAGDPAFKEDPMAWRRDPGMIAVCCKLTWVLVVFYAIKVAIMLPLYLTAQVGLLAVGKVVLGWPAWALTLAVMAWMLLKGHTPQQVPALDSDETQHELHPDE